MKPLFWLIAFIIPFAAFAQGHQSSLASCRFYVDPPRKPGEIRVTAIDGPVCMACRKERQDKREKEEAEYKRQAEERKAKFEKEEADRAAKIKADEERNKADLADLAALKKSIDQQDEIDSKRRQQEAEVKKRYTEKEAKANQEYNDYLGKLQEAEKLNIPPSIDDSWNETILPANYLPVENKETRMWGFVNKQGRQVLGYEYEFASPFSKGVAFVRLNDKERNSALIDTKGNIVKTFSKNYFSSISTGAVAINSFNYHSFSDGILVVDFYTDDYRNKNRMGCIDKKGDLLIPPSFARIDTFKNGTAKAAKHYNSDDLQLDNDRGGDFKAHFDYYEVGIIDHTGNWISPPRKKLEYTYGYYALFGLVLEDLSDKRSYAEKQAEKLRNEQEWKVTYTRLMAQLESKVKAKVDAAKSQGMLTEQMN